jgi:hypothetical protein
MRIAEYTDDELKFEKNRFMKTMPTIQKRQEYAELITGNNLMIEGSEKVGLLSE